LSFQCRSLEIGDSLTSKKNEDQNGKRELFFRSITPKEMQIVSKLQNHLKNFPTLEERISYSVLYYFQNSRVCFIWPASIPLGPKSGVQLGFCNGYLLEDPQRILEKKDRKQVYTLTFQNTEEIDEILVRSFLDNALAVDRTLFQKK